MPGYCWSDWPPRAGWTLKDNARIFDKLMKKLEYRQYIFQGGDWAHFVGRELGAKYSDSCLLVHFNMAPSPMPDNVTPSERESAVMDQSKDVLENDMGYAATMRSRPHTLGFALHDNPLGILMWVGEKYNELANPENQKDANWTKHILSTASLYYFSGCIMPSMLCYYENVRHENYGEYAIQQENIVKAPFGHTSCYWDAAPASKRAAEHTGNLVFYRGELRGYSS